MQIEKLHDVYLALGTNLGDKEENIFRAMKYINERVGMLIVHSALYSTQPVGFQSENDFINAACLVMTSLTPLELLSATQEIEREMGRVEKSVGEVYTDRIIDVDILLYDNRIVEELDLKLPHPHLHEREFVLYPLAEIGGDYVHPILNKSIRQLAEEMKNASDK